MQTAPAAGAVRPPTREIINRSGLAPYVPRMLNERAADGPTYWSVDGTLVIADVSGFTRLTERLSRQGRIGAEEIVETISAVFTALLSTSQDGGDVLKFSGDALVLFFAGEDHAHRAVHAALDMQSTLRRVGGIDSSVGRIRLRMSVGAHAGRFHFFVCGAPHLELFVLGESASTAVAMENAAERGQVLVDPGTAAMLPGRVRATVRAGGTVIRAVAPLPPVAGADPTPGAPIERFVPIPLRDRLAADDGEHEHRQVAVAFASFGGVDDLLRVEGPQEVFERVQQLTVETMSAADEYGVLLTATDVGRDGGMLMLTAGAPVTTGDDEARILHVVRRMTMSDCGLPVRAGVNAGNVFVGAVGAPFRRAYSTMGAAANVAARAMTAAAWGQVLATAAVADRVRGRFVLDDVPPFTAKGLRQPVPASVVGAATDRQAGAGTDAVGSLNVPLIGRDAEINALMEALAGAEAGTGQIVEIVGETGVGKSRLVRELQHRAGASSWFLVTCDPYERTSAYSAARVLLRRMMGLPLVCSAEDAGVLLEDIVRTSAPEVLPWLPLLAAPLGAVVAPSPEADEIANRYRRARTHQLVCDVLGATAEPRAVIVVEDAHVMDGASAELFADVFSRVVAARSWLAVVTREDNLQGLHSGRGYAALRLEVPPLDPSATAQLAEKLAERMPVPVHLLPELVDRAAGNPLFLFELVAAQAAGADAMPRSVEDIVAARIDLLSPEDRRALRYVSVLGDRFDAPLVDAVLRPLGVDSGQQELWDRLRGFVVREEDSFVFRNALVRQAAYEGLSYERRRHLHSRVADVLASRSGAAAQLPLHLTWAQRWQEAWSAALDAAEEARRSAANAVAGELYALALTAARHLDLPDEEIARVARRTGEVWERAGVWDLALAAYAKAASAARDAADRVALQLRRASVHESAGRYAQALRLYSRAMTAADALVEARSRDRGRARAHAGYASVRLAQGDPAAAVRQAERAAVFAEASQDRETVAHAYHLLGRAFAALGDHDAAARYRDLALPVFSELGDLAAQGTVLHDLGSDAQRAGRVDEALWFYERSHEVRMRAGDVVGAASSANAIGEALLADGRLTEAAERFADALRAWRGARYPQGVSVALLNLGVIARRAGETAEACRHLDEAYVLATQIGGAAILADIRIALADAFLDLGRFVEAWDMATEALAAGDEGKAGSAHRIRGQALLATGGTVRAGEELRAAAALAGDAEESRTIERLLQVVAGP